MCVHRLCNPLRLYGISSRSTALFGAFIAGASFSAFLKLDDVANMINRLKGLGLLLYFTSLGLQLYLGISSMQSLDTVLIGIALGMAAYIVRAIGLFIATLFTTESLAPLGRG